MNYKKYNDYELLYMVREKDDFSGDILYQKYQPLLSKIAMEFYNQYRVYGYDFEDFFQEASIAFQKSVFCYDELKNIQFYTFVMVCVRRRLLSFCRKISNSKKNVPNYELVSIDETSVSDEKSDVFSFFQNIEFQKFCRDTILNTDIEVSSVFELKMNGFTIHEIEQLLNIPKSTVEYKFRVAKQYLQQLLSNSTL